MQLSPAGRGSPWTVAETMLPPTFSQWLRDNIVQSGAE